MNNFSKTASNYTKKSFEKFNKELPFDDTRDFERAQKGFIGTTDADGIYSGDVCIWNFKAYDFENLDQPCPDTVNPSLWRQSQLNHIHGLFEVMPGVYQIRGFDMANMTIFESDTGIVIVDTLNTKETSEAAMALYEKHRGKRDIKAVIYSHSHVDHYGGVRGLITDEDVTSGRIPLYSPNGFLLEAVSENALAGNAMGRRTIYMCGPMLPKGPMGHVDIGLGKGAVSGGTMTILPPSYVVKEKIENHTIDGIEIEFMQVPNTEAPAEMIMYFPQFKLLLAAEDVTHNLHNLLTPRGAQVRDSRMWWKAIDDMLTRYGDKTEVLCAVHHWPVWSNEDCVEMLTLQRDVYKYMHDQSVRLLNLGFNATEIAEQMEFPPVLGNQWSVRGYYGSLNHDTKAVYQRYLGWYDMNPANFHALPPEDAAKKYVELAGGADSLLKQIQAAYDAGEYRWGAEIGKHLVFAQPENKAAMGILADIYEQLGYQTENGTWRSIYLQGAMELRLAAADKKIPFPDASPVNPDILDAMTDELFYDFTASRLNGPKAVDSMIRLEVTQTDKGTTYGLLVQNGVLNFHKDEKFDKPDASIKLTRETLSKLVLREKELADEISAGNIEISGSTEKVKEFLELLDKIGLGFNIVMP